MQTCMNLNLTVALCVAEMYIFNLWLLFIFFDCTGASNPWARYNETRWNTSHCAIATQIRYICKHLEIIVLLYPRSFRGALISSPMMLRSIDDGLKYITTFYYFWPTLVLQKWKITLEYNSLLEWNLFIYLLNVRLIIVLLLDFWVKEVWPLKFLYRPVERFKKVCAQSICCAVGSSVFMFCLGRAYWRFILKAGWICVYIYRAFRLVVRSSFVFCKQQLWSAKINHVIYFSTNHSCWLQK